MPTYKVLVGFNAPVQGETDKYEFKFAGQDVDMDGETGAQYVAINFVEAKEAPETPAKAKPESPRASAPAPPPKSRV